MKMILNAISMGYAIPHADFDAVIHSVFRTAINLRLSQENRLLTIVAINEADLPQGIRVDTPDDFSFEIFHADEPVTCRNGNLRFDSLIIELRGAQRWKCDLPALRVDLTDPAISTSWRNVWLALNQRQVELNAEIIAQDLFDSVESMRAGVPRMAGKAMRDLLGEARRYDLTLASSSARALIGLGSGLTPSGDDLLVGCLAGLWCTVRRQGERAQFVSNLGDTIIHHSQQTNEISRAYLYHAAQGQVSSLLANLAEAVSTGKDPDRLLNAAEAAMRVGHTSGMDAVTGLLTSLAAWEGNHLLTS